MRLGYADREFDSRPSQPFFDVARRARNSLPFDMTPPPPPPVSEPIHQFDLGVFGQHTLTAEELADEKVHQADAMGDTLQVRHE